MKPDYHKIFEDLIEKKYPNKKEECKSILKKQELSFLDIISLNNKIFGTSDLDLARANQKHRSYNRSTIVEILSYGKKKQFK